MSSKNRRASTIHRVENKRAASFADILAETFADRVVVGKTDNLVTIARKSSSLEDVFNQIKDKWRKAGFIIRSGVNPGRLLDQPQIKNGFDVFVKSGEKKKQCASVELVNHIGCKNFILITYTATSANLRKLEAVREEIAN